MDNSNGKVFYPIINSIQRIALYETKSKYYLVGSNNTQTRFRLLKIDRMESKDLEIYDDKVEYTAEEIRNLIGMIESGNRRSGGGGFSKVISAFGIVGFIKFLEGYYIILITKRRRVALIGHYTIYKIEDTSMVYIPHESIRIVHSDEARYVKMFQNIDLASNFYYSYSYDLTHTLQYNLSTPKRFIHDKKDVNLSTSILSNSSNHESQTFGIRTQPHKKFVWNHHLLSEALKTELHPDWVLYIIHGFIDQLNINVFGKAIYITLIARRSSRYAGTRFLKRGANFQGDVANEVETEQIVHDSSISYFNKSHFTSFVQMRGSIPGYQLCALGVIDTPNLEFDTDCVRMLESLYEDHGDTLALQYGGSQLVHRIKTYRKTAPWTSQGNDIVQTISRYYSNTFSDAEKQNAINLFLGVFQPEEDKPQIWEYTTDYYFHHKPFVFGSKSLTQWWDEGVLRSLPYAYNDLTKGCSELIQVHSQDAEMIDSYVEYYRPYELTVLSDVFALKISNSIRDFMPTSTINFSPFTIRVRPVRRREHNSSKPNAMKNPSVTGQSSVCSTASSTSSSSDEGSADEEESSNTNDSLAVPSKDTIPEPITFKSLFPTMKQVYGTELKKPNFQDVLTYKKYVLIGKKAIGTAKNVFQSISTNQKMLDEFSTDSVYRVTPPEVSATSIDIYKRYVQVGQNGGFSPKTSDIQIYEMYAKYE
ncbi:polyphosphoinositide phosphatase isoform X2 [Diorhabda sublineata]|uniref:polyphosphoinositide phosphatase isoform X2 n=1 Tax=Diorhabda sublineata TaxID=1163346 RepID=UPI0024E0F500|nr:polyphosphoinositide phosphatase isoform X2 [Diorhabda sublineata]